MSKKTSNRKCMRQQRKMSDVSRDSMRDGRRGWGSGKVHKNHHSYESEEESEDRATFLAELYDFDDFDEE